MVGFVSLVNGWRRGGSIQRRILFKAAAVLTRVGRIWFGH